MANAPRDANRIPGIIGADSSTLAATPATIDHTDDGVWVHIVGQGGIISSAPSNGQVKMTGSAVQFPSNALVNGVIVTAKSTNAAPIVIGLSNVANATDGTGNGYILEAGASASWAVSNTNVLWAIGTSADVLSFAGS